MKLIVGLGNPEDKYTGTRHNLGFEVINKFFHKINSSNTNWENNSKFNAELVIINSELILAKPQTYMNNSGIAVAKLAKFYKIEPDDTIIIHDDIDLELGHIKVRSGGASAGHHGVESIIKDLNTDKFIRIRLGIGNLKSLSGEHKKISFNAEHFVLEPFLQTETSTVKRMVKKTVNALEILLSKGLEKAQNQFN